ncbi:MAG TPA: RNA polymerase sigma-70 factor [Flavisolibacter sp.]|nr:RNA polymerase sigma-70 factor [Flavisolibacter sp.]
MKHITTDNDKQLLIRLLANDESAFTELFNQYYFSVIEYVSKFLKSKPLSEDVTHELFISLWEDRQKLKDVESFKAYLFTCARNKTLNLLKAISRSEIALGEIVKTFPSRPISGEEKMLEKEYISFIHAAVQKLPTRSREVFLLCRESGHTYKEVAQALHISRNAVKNHMVYSIRKIKGYAQRDLGISFSLISLLFCCFK